jgi:hypothetical protein
MLTLDKLPAEVIYLVLTFLPSAKDAANVSRQCRFIHNLCEMDERRKYAGVCITDDISMIQAFEFLSSLLIRPRRRFYVHKLECSRFNETTFHHLNELIRDARCSKIIDLAKKATIDADNKNFVIKNLMEIVEVAGLSRNAKGRSMRFGHLFLTLAAVFIKLSPNLESLAVAFNESTEYWVELSNLEDKNLPRSPLFPLDHIMNETPLDDMLKRPLSPNKGFPWSKNLREVRLHASGSRPSSFISDLSVIYKLPTVETLGLGGFNHDYKLKVSLMSSNIRSLHFTDIRLRENVLLAAICGPKALVQLSYGRHQYITLMNHRWEIPGATLRVISQALLVHRDSLKSLRLDLRGYLETWFTPFPCGISEGYIEEDRLNVSDDQKAVYKHVDVQIGSLKDFSALEHLDMQVDLFLHLARGVPRLPEHRQQMAAEQPEFSLASSLPPKLKTLYIRGDEIESGEECIKQIRELRTLMSKNRFRQIDVQFKSYAKYAALFA